MKKINLFFTLFCLALISSHCKKESQTEQQTAETVKDADGNVYKTMKMGNQVWMLENLKTTKYNDGTPIAKWTFGNNWYYSINPVAYYQWANTSDLNKVYPNSLSFDYYGAIYNETALSSGKLAPAGWRIPTEQDFKVLESYVAAQGYAGNEATALKSKIGWHSGSGNGTDIFGFNGLPNGYVAHGGTATGSELISSWATSEVNAAAKTRRSINLNKNGQMVFADFGVSLGSGVRCIKE